MARFRKLLVFCAVTLMAYAFVMTGNANAYAEEQSVVIAPDDDATSEEVFYYEVLQQQRFMASSTATEGSTQVEALEELLDAAAKEGNTTIDVYSVGIPSSDASTVLSAVLNDVSVASSSFDATSYGWSIKNGVVYKLNLTTSYSSIEIANRYSVMKAALDEVVAKVDENYSDEEKALFIHDYIAYNTAYNYDALNGSYSDYKDAYTIYGVLVEKTAVCQGYAEAYKLILNEVGIDALVVSSTSLNHAWNQVYLNDNWYHVDVTWDDPGMSYYDNTGNEAPSSGNDMLGLVKHEYFLLSADSMYNAGHNQTWDSGTYQESTDTSYEGDLQNISSRVYDVDGTFYFLYDPNTTGYLNTHLYSGDPFAGSSSFTILDSGKANYGYNLGYYDGKFYYDDYFYGYLYCYNIATGTVTDVRSDIGIDSSYVSELDVSETGLLRYILNSSSTIYTYQLPKATVKVTGVSLDTTSASMAIGDTLTLIATVAPSDADNTAVTWASSDTSVVTVKDGVVTAVGGGTATVTVTTDDGSYEATCDITVAYDPIVNTSFISQEAIVGQKVVFKGSATGGSGTYQYAYYYRKTSDSNWTTAGTEWGTAVYATAKPGSNTVYEVCIKVRDANDTSNVVKKYLSFAANTSETSLKCYGSVYKTIYKYGRTNYITASSEGNASGSTVQYKYEYRKASSWTYETIKDYSEDTSVSWDAPQTGSFTLRITAYDGTDYAIRTINIKVKP